MPERERILEANKAYVETFTSGDLPISPARKIAVLTCMDARLDIHALAGMKIGDAHVIRNAGGRASDDAIRSLVISQKLLGTGHVIVIHHTDCGMTSFTDEVMRRMLAESIGPSEKGPDGWRNANVGTTHGSTAGEFINWLTFSDLAESVRTDVRRIREHALIRDDILVSGMIYEVETGKLVPVEGA